MFIFLLSDQSFVYFGGDPYLGERDLAVCLTHTCRHAFASIRPLQAGVGLACSGWTCLPKDRDGTTHPGPTAGKPAEAGLSP